MERAKNTASSEELRKVFRANGVKCIDTSVLVLGIEEFAERFEEIILDILRLTKRPLEKQLAIAVREASTNAIPIDTATKFAHSICEVVSLCRYKRKHMTSGDRLPKHLKNIVEQLDKPSDLGAKAELLQRQPEPQLPLQQSRSNSALTARPLQRSSMSSEIMKSYQLTSISKAIKVDKDIEVLSSQEVDSPAPAPTSAPALATGRSWVDTHKRTVAQVDRSGQIKYAKLQDGPDGFAVAHFTGNSPGTSTEIPNVLAQPVWKKPAAVSKKPAATAKKKPAATAKKKPASAVASEEEEEEEGEELEDEGEEEEPEEQEEGVVEEDAGELQSHGHGCGFLKKVVSPVLGVCKATYCEHKAYIQQKSAECAGGWKSIVNFSASLSLHKEAVHEIMEKLKMPGYGQVQVDADKIRLLIPDDVN